MTFEHQTVTLVGVTQPTVKHESALKAGEWEGYGIKRNLTPDEFIAYCARVSNPGNQGNTETAPKLIKYLIRNEHWSPFEMVSVVMEIKTTRDIGRQILRHRSFSFQEFSQRYAQATEIIDNRQLRLQDAKNRQNSIDIDIGHPFETEWDDTQKKIAEIATESYRRALDNGIAKEQARALLPEGLTMSTMLMSGTLRSWIHYVKLRAANGTQKEHMDIAIKCRDILVKEFPSCEEYLLND